MCHINRSILFVLLIMLLCVISKYKDHGGTKNLKECLWYRIVLQGGSVPRVSDHVIQTVPRCIILENFIAFQTFCT
jgi:hypothetical protein